MKKSITTLDLNLLLCLQLLMQERSVTKAAKRMNVTPSAVSKSLAKLRAWFDDPLFVNSPLGLSPTPLMVSMEQNLAEWMQMSNLLLDKPHHQTPRGLKFELAAESPLMMIMLNALSKRIYQRYPQATIKLRNWDYDSLDAITRGEVDIGFSGRESHPRSRELLSSLPLAIDYEVLFSDVPCVWLRKDHPALHETWNLDTFLRYPHISICWEQSDTWALDNVLQELGRERTIAMSLPEFEQSLFMAVENPRTAEGGSANHHRIYAVALEGKLGFLWSRNIAVTDDRNMDAGIVFHLSDEAPVGFTRVHLASGSAVDGECLYSAILQLLGKLGDDEVIAIPTQSGFHGYGHVDRFYYFSGDVEHQRNIAEHSGSGTLSGNLLHRATEVNINHIWLRLFHNLGSFHHVLGGATVNLNAHRALLIAYRKLADGALDASYQGFCRYELSINHSSSKSLAEHAKANIRYVFHRGEEEGLRPKFYISYFHLNLSVLFCFAAAKLHLFFEIAKHHLE